MKSPINNITMEEFLDSLPKKEREITVRLRKIVLKTAPELKEKFSYGVPYYFGKTRVCFIWPASAPFGKKNSSVEFGFCRGDSHQASDETEARLRSSLLHGGLPFEGIWYPFRPASL